MKNLIFCHIMNVFTITSDQLNASLLNKNINLFKNINGSIYGWVEKNSR